MAKVSKLYFKNKLPQYKDWTIVKISDSKAHNTVNTYLRFMIPVEISRKLALEADELIGLKIEGSEIRIKPLTLSLP